MGRGLFPLMLTVLNGDDNGGTIIPIQGCQYKGEHPKESGLRRYILEHQDMTEP